MMRYARMVAGRVAELIHLPEDIPPADAFHADIAAALEAAPEEVAEGWRMVDGDWLPPAGPSLDERRALVIGTISERVAACLAAGAPYAGERIALDAGSRADLGSMATTALAAQAGSVQWPESYALGWISISNVRLPMATPEDGLLLAAAAGDCYAQIVQAGRSLKDAALNALDEAALAAIDIDLALPLGAGDGEG